MSHLHGTHYPFFNKQPAAPAPAPMTAEEAAAILSKQAHRGENRWWIESRQDYFEGKTKAHHISVCTHSLKLHPFEAIAIARAYQSEPHAVCYGSSGLTVQ